ncbi:unnamed protein product [Soboliphyme baturini]|uniref:MFS domain-containing protein n=1 Tax=Soboliphyme baturini TaxID=241478 RepID=A0A183J3J5_9BILA|nr:unnamed protein product [Soboliphyme baturini]
MVAIRVLQGISQVSIALQRNKLLHTLFQGLAFPSMQALWSQWAPTKEKARLVGFSFSGCYYGTAMAIPFSTYLAEWFGWEAIFYFAGGLSMVWAFIWLFTISDSPYADSRISEHELDYITEGTQGCGSKREVPEVPWIKILLSVPVWTIVVLHVTQNWGFYTMLTYLPKFMNQFLQFQLKTTGLLGAVPYLAMGLMLTLAGTLADLLKSKTNISLLNLRKLYGAGGSFLQALFTILAIQWSDSSCVMTFVCLIIAFAAFPFSAYSVNQLDIAATYASVIMGLSNTIATIPGMVSPPIVGAIVRDGTPWEWMIVFYIIAGFYTFGGVVYLLLAKADTQRWAKKSQIHNGD